jgi:hypothetical protein
VLKSTKINKRTAGTGGAVGDKQRLESKNVDPVLQGIVDFCSASYGVAWGNCRNLEIAINSANHH